MLELTVRLIASLAVVVGLLLLIAKVGGRRMRGRSGSLVQVVHRQPLSRASAVAVVTGRVARPGPGHHRAAGQRPHRARPRRAGRRPRPSRARPTRTAADHRPGPPALTRTSPSSRIRPPRGGARRRSRPAGARRPCPRAGAVGDRTGRVAPATARSRIGAVAADLEAGPRGRHGQGVMTRLLRASACSPPRRIWLALPSLPPRLRAGHRRHRPSRRATGRHRQGPTRRPDGADRAGRARAAPTTDRRRRPDRPLEQAQHVGHDAHRR